MLIDVRESVERDINAIPLHGLADIDQHEVATRLACLQPLLQLGHSNSVTGHAPQPPHPVMATPHTR